MIGKIVKVIVDRPLGSYYPVHKNLFYPVNYGYFGRVRDGTFILFATEGDYLEYIGR